MIFHLQKSIMPHRYIPARHISSTTRIVTTENLTAVAYKPAVVEKDHLKWEKISSFKAENPSNKPSFSMVLPPPNVTGKLHLGHALACTIQDVLVRRKRSLGHNVLWVPGTDHAGIATQGVVEKYIQNKHQTTRHQLGREKFNREVWKWKEEHGNAIIQQLKILGCSLDWSRQIFTMDQQHTRAVNFAFIQLYHQGLIYRNKSLVNWCNSLKSTVSDIEVDKLEMTGPKEVMLPGNKCVTFGQIYDFAYKLFDSDEEVVVSTTMPETMLGDAAIAVHPDDERYKHLKDQVVVHPFVDRYLPIIFDDFVDMNFGTGAVKITPAHSKIDYNVAKKHNLPLFQVIDEERKMINAGPFTKLQRYDCRKTLLEKLNSLGLLKKVSPHPMTLPVCSRTGDVIEHLPKEQWFLSCRELNKQAEEVVRKGHLQIEPQKFVKNWMDWTEGDRDWCISRQLWWGHQVPAYKCSVGGHKADSVWVVAPDDNTAKQQATKFFRTMPEHIKAERDTDVLDTWFSSAIYPFSSLGWPDAYKSSDYSKFYPLSLMATGHDILGFWVHRMVLMGLALTQQLPFQKVLLHGIICDGKGAKMSKSKGNVIDPLDVIKGISMEGLQKKSADMYSNGILSKEEYEKAIAYHKSNYSNTEGIPDCGVDALRFTIVSHDIKSHFVNFDLGLCHTNKLFCNKIWQSVKYSRMAFSRMTAIEDEITEFNLTYFDKWILSRVANMVEVVNTSIDNYDLHIATKALKNLIYSEFCDFYLESTKPGVYGDDAKTAYAHAHTLSAVLNTSLRCLAPFMPYLVEELITKVPAFETNIIYNFDDQSKPFTDYPQYKDWEKWRNKDVELQADKLLGTVALVRQLKGFYGISNKVRPTIYVTTTDHTLCKGIADNMTIIQNLTKCGSVDFSVTPNTKYVTAVLDTNTKVSVELLVDDVEKVMDSSRHNLVKKIRKTEDALTKLEAKFASTIYMSTTPEWHQMLDKERIHVKREELKQLQRLIEA